MLRIRGEWFIWWIYGEYLIPREEKWLIIAKCVWWSLPQIYILFHTFFHSSNHRSVVWHRTPRKKKRLFQLSIKEEKIIYDSAHSAWKTMLKCVKRMRNLKSNFSSTTTKKIVLNWIWKVINHVTHMNISCNISDKIRHKKITINWCYAISSNTSKFVSRKLNKSEELYAID